MLLLYYCWPFLGSSKKGIRGVYPHTNESNPLRNTVNIAKYMHSFIVKNCNYSQNFVDPLLRTYSHQRIYHTLPFPHLLHVPSPSSYRSLQKSSWAAKRKRNNTVLNVISQVKLRGKAAPCLNCMDNSTVNGMN